MSYFGSIYADQELSHRARTVYMYLKDRSDAGNTCWPSVRRIAEDLKLSRRTVQRAESYQRVCFCAQRILRAICHS